ncbi:MAG: preprotein translocase subunit SecY [Lachnospiraceae bacterium]|nr:preprotein translocase subunit SecY [Lachnospiraceae bacterium]
MFKTLHDALRSQDIRKRLLYTFFMLIVVRLGSQIPIPFVNDDVVKQLTKQFSEGAFSFFAAITGGSMEKMSLFSLSITPYITASIIIQLLTIAIPWFEEKQKDGEEGRKVLAKITRYVTVALAIIESTALVWGFANQGMFDTETLQYGVNMHKFREVAVVVTGIITMTAGSAVLMWIGEQITEKGVGNGISIVLTINIVSRIPSDVSNLFTNYVGGAKSFGGKITAAVLIIAIIVAIVAFVVILQGAQRNIAVQMSQKVQGRRRVGGQQSSIPLKVNTAGVIPVIFASSILQFPIVIGSFFGKSPEWMNYLNQSNWCDPARLKYSIGFVVYLVLIIFFAYFYTSITFNPREVAKNLNDRGSTIPGIRSGKPTVEYLTSILNYIILIGAIGLIIVAAIPILASGIAGANVSFGGTSIIIIVGVIIETLATIKAMTAERSYKDIKSIF